MRGLGLRELGVEEFELKGWGLGSWGFWGVGGLRVISTFELPHAAHAQRGVKLMSTKKIQNFFNLSKYSLSEVHSNTCRN